MMSQAKNSTGTGDEAPLMLSVSGARGIVGRTMTPATAATFAGAFGSFLKRSTGVTAPTVCLGRDSRPSGEMLAAAARAGLTSVGCRVIELGIVTTPTVGVMIAAHRAQGGMVITASHNPLPWNGLKCLNHDGVAPPPADAAEIIRCFRENDLAYAPVESLVRSEVDESGTRAHLEAVLGLIDARPIVARGFRVVLDSVNGAGCLGGRELLTSLGCTIEHLNGEPTGIFAHTPEPTEANLTDLANVVQNTGAAVGFAQDPDADRLAIVDETGRYIGEEYTLVLAARRALDLHAAGVPPFANASPTLAANLSTSRMIDDLAAKYDGARVLRTAVGEANVVAALKPANGLFGGEGNGGVILPAVCWVRDSYSAMALVLSLMAAENRPLSEIVNDLPRYRMLKHKFDLASIGGLDAINPMLAKVRKRFSDARLNDADGVRLDFDDGWVHLRPSNTEPIVRLIAEAETDSRAWELIDEVAVAAGLQ